MKKLLAIEPSPPRHWVGDGFPVRSVFDYAGRGREMSPFLLLDHAEPTDFPPSDGTGAPRGVGSHPHRGFETVTVVHRGELAHRDSSGGGGVIGPGDVQWMTAGAGLVHEEFHSPEFTRRGGTLEMVQLWVNLPARHKGAPPGYQAILDRDIPRVPLGEGIEVRVIAGRLGEVEGPARTFTPINLWEARAAAGRRASLPLPDGHTTALFVAEGRIAIDGRSAERGELVRFSREGEGVRFEATEDSRLLVLDGEPIDEPIVGSGPFVMNSREEIVQAYEDFRKGRMGTIPEG